MKNEKKIRVGFLVSGNGGSLKFIHQAAQHLDLPLEVSIVLADRACGALNYARAAGLPHQQLHYTRKSPAALQQALREAKPDVVVTNIHKIIDAGTLNLLPQQFINLHYSLLPAFKGFIGMETVEQARTNNVTIIGATCHEVDEEVDNGRCMGQFAFGVNWGYDTTTDVYELMFRGASLVLLQGLLQRTIQQPVVADSAFLITMGRQLLFAPALNFSPETLDELFWQHVKDSM